MRGYTFVCRNQNCNRVFEHKQTLCCNVGNWNVRYLSPWPVLHVVRQRHNHNVHEQVQDQLFREEPSSVTDAFCPRWTMCVGGKEGKHWCFEFVSFFFHINAFWLGDFCIWVGGFDGEQVNQPHWEFYMWPKLHGGLCKQKLNQPRKCCQSSHWDEGLSLSSCKTKSRTLVWVWEDQLCYPNCYVQPDLSTIITVTVICRVKPCWYME